MVGVFPDPVCAQLSIASLIKEQGFLPTSLLHTPAFYSPTNVPTLLRFLMLNEETPGLQLCYAEGLSAVCNARSASESCPWGSTSTQAIPTLATELSGLDSTSAPLYLGFHLSHGNSRAARQRVRRCPHLGGSYKFLRSHVRWLSCCGWRHWHC